MGLEYSPGEFVYTTTKPPSESPSVVMNRQVDPFSSLPTEQKRLLHHFILEASHATSCHSGMQTEICKMIVPMALQTPSLLYATMALSAIHLEALNMKNETVKSLPDIARLMARSLEHFRTALQDSNFISFDALLATARTLCLAEIHSGAIHPNTWRVHVEGAKALMSASEANSNTNDSLRKYLIRWYRSIVSLTALNGNGPPIDSHLGNVETKSLIPPDGPDYLDDYWGFTVNLAEIFREIGAMAWRRHQPVPVDDQDWSHRHAEFEESANFLEQSVQSLILKGSASSPSFYPGVLERLSQECIREFALCNEAFQHTALIHIHRRIRQTPACSEEVQRSVKKILECISQIVPKPGLSPWVTLTTPLFTAGCESLGEDREEFKKLFISLYKSTRIPNVLQSLKFLEVYWENGPKDEGEDWSHFLGECNYTAPYHSREANCFSRPYEF